MTADGDLQIGMSAVAGVQLDLGGSYTNAANETVHTSALGLKSQSGAATEVVNNISMNLDLGPQTTYIRNLAGRTAAQKTALGLPTASHDGSVAIQQTMALRINEAVRPVATAACCHGPVFRVCLLVCAAAWCNMLDRGQWILPH